MSVPNLPVTIEPLGSQVLVYPSLPEAVSASGLQLSASKEKPNRGIVMGLGGALSSDKHVSVGDTVVFSPAAGLDLEISDTSGKTVTLKMLEAKDVLGRIK